MSSYIRLTSHLDGTFPPGSRTSCSCTRNPPASSSSWDRSIGISCGLRTDSRGAVEVWWMLWPRSGRRCSCAAKAQLLGRLQICFGGRRLNFSQASK